jgi:putative flippase GtrA
MNKYRDLASRAAWTAVQAVLSVVTVEALGLPLVWAPIVATVLSAIKSFVATKVGDPDTVTFKS